MKRLTEQHLAERWQMSVRTLQNWRWMGRGPRYLKIGARVLYPLDEIEAYEAGQLHANTSGPVRAGGA
ncbi:helix-turn-helix transcriptional regulator [Tropicimonas aquimaris]|uniref:Helix-turn-helix transcriptional regulator n=1 Tax=Tropicimonas aquimaris TaxID=914152 RepID=A0ABW3IV58_9RHOB